MDVLICKNPQDSVSGVLWILSDHKNQKKDRCARKPEQPSSAVHKALQCSSAVCSVPI